MVRHCHIYLTSNFNENEHQNSCQYYFNEQESNIIETEIEKLTKLKVIKPVEPQSSQCLSPIFVRPTKNGEQRMILNLKKLSSYILYHHFKMDTFEKNSTIYKKRLVYGKL